MTAMDGDGIDEELTRAVSAAMLAAARAGEHFARMNQTKAAEREAHAAGQAEQAQRQLDAYTEAARAYFEVTGRPEYTGAATAEQLQEVARTAELLGERLPEAQRAKDAAAAELTARTSAAGHLERATVLASEAGVAESRADVPDPAEQHSNTIGEPDPPSSDDTRAQVIARAGEGAPATAQTAQARLAGEATLAAAKSTRRRTHPTSPTRNCQTGIER